MPDFTMKSGRVLHIDVMQVTTREWRKVTSAAATSEDEDALISKCTGLTADEIADMPMIESRAVIKEIVKTILSPLASPNFPGAST